MKSKCEFVVAVVNENVVPYTMIVHYYDRSILLLVINQVSLGKSNCGSSGEMLTLVNDLGKKNLWEFKSRLSISIYFTDFDALLEIETTSEEKKTTTVGWGKKAWVRFIFKVLTAGKYIKTQ